MEEKIGEVIKKIINKIDVVEERKIKDIEVLWNRVVDEKIRGYSYTVGIKKNVLIVKVDGSCILNEFRIRKEEIKKKLKNFGIKDIKFII